MKNKTIVHQFTGLAGDLARNFEQISELYSSSKADLHIFSDLALSGGPLYDIGQNQDFIAQQGQYLGALAKLTDLNNDAMLISVADQSYKMLLIYSGAIQTIATKNNWHETITTTLSVANSAYHVIWGNQMPGAERLTSTTIVLSNLAYGPDFLEAIKIYGDCAQDNKIQLLLSNPMYLQEKLFYPGFSAYFGHSGMLSCLGFASGSLTESGGLPNLNKDYLDYTVAVTALKQYFISGNFEGIVLGVSGGIDSALSIVLACDAIGPERVHALTMPTQFNDPEVVCEAMDFCKKLGVKCLNHDINSMYETCLDALKLTFGGLRSNVTSENLQSRIRGTILMAYSNDRNLLALNSGNKTELLLGYCTLYGDMCGGYSVIADLYKGDIYRLAKWRNHNLPEGLCNVQSPIPLSFITKAPTAELRKDQTDESDLKLGTYEEMDRALKILTGDAPNLAAPQCMSAVKKRMYRTEYKRRQACPSVRITSRTTRRLTLIQHWL